MPAGRPKVPNEVHRRRGNPGKRALPSPSMELQSIDEVPEPPRPLLKHGNAFWQRTWEMGRTWISPEADIELLLMTCELIDEEWNLRIKVMNEGNARDRRALRDLQRLKVSNLSLLGFTPADRSRLGVAEIKAKSKLAELKAIANG